MFGLKRMHKQRDRLYLRTQIFEKQAKMSREKAIDNVLEKVSSPTGLFVSFVLGASTQLDIRRKIRKSLLNGASRDVMSFLIAQVSAYMSAVQTDDSEKEPSNEESTTSPTTSKYSDS